MDTTYNIRQFKGSYCSCSQLVDDSSVNSFYASQSGVELELFVVGQGCDKPCSSLGHR